MQKFFDSHAEETIGTQKLKKKEKKGNCLSALTFYRGCLISNTFACIMEIVPFNR